MIPQSPDAQPDMSALLEHEAVNVAVIKMFVGGAAFPCDKQELVERARSKGAPPEVLEVMNHLPNWHYSDTAEVAQGFDQVKRQYARH